MIYLLDTHVVCWAVLEAERLSMPVKSILENLTPQDQLAVADITLWEIAMLICKQRLIINIPLQQWIEQCIINLKLQIIPLSAEIVADSVQLPNNFHSDPADQLIVATARCIKATLLTRDQKILDWAKSGFLHTLAA